MADLQLQTFDHDNNGAGVYGYVTAASAPEVINAARFPELTDFGQLRVQAPTGLSLESYYLSPVASPTQEPFGTVVSSPAAPVLGGNFGGLEQSGPLIGALQPVKGLLQDSIASSPELVREAKRLLQRFASYRSIRRDGNSAWRALSFGYFEMLQKTRDADLIAREEIHFRELDSILREGGFEQFGYTIFADATFVIFQTLLADLVEERYDDDTILGLFSNQTFSDSVVTHFKLMTSAWMLKYAPYYHDLGIPADDFRKRYIEPFDLELEVQGFDTAVDCIFSNSLLGCEIVRLNAEFNGEVSARLAGMLDLGSPGLKRDVLRILNRPDGYDVIYIENELSPSPASIPLPLSPISTIAPRSGSISVSIYPQSPDEYFPVHEIEFSTSPSAAPLSPASLSNFRPSMFQLPEFQPQPLPSVPFQTATFKNSPFNPSHYQSANFQPELYNPEDDEK